MLQMLVFLLWRTELLLSLKTSCLAMGLRISMLRGHLAVCNCNRVERWLITDTTPTNLLHYQQCQCDDISMMNVNIFSTLPIEATARLSLNNWMPDILTEALPSLYHIDRFSIHIQLWQHRIKHLIEDIHLIVKQYQLFHLQYYYKYIGILFVAIPEIVSV